MFAGFHHGPLFDLSREMYRHVRSDPWTAINVLDDVMGANAAMLAAPMTAYETAHAERGDKVAQAASGAIAFGSILATGSAVWKLTALFAPEIPVIGWAATAVGSIFVTSAISSFTHNSVLSGLRMLKSQERSVLALNMGGHYIDTPTTALWRRAALSDLSGSLGAARSFLGREGLFLHR